MKMTTLLPLTDRQRDIWDYIARYHRRERMGVTLRGICAEFGMRSPNGAVSHIIALEKKGWIQRRRRGARTIVPTQESIDANA